MDEKKKRQKKFIRQCRFEFQEIKFASSRLDKKEQRLPTKFIVLVQTAATDNSLLVLPFGIKFFEICSSLTLPKKQKRIKRINPRSRSTCVFRTSK
jgi:hypothetical protein